MFIFEQLEIICKNVIYYFFSVFIPLQKLILLILSMLEKRQKKKKRKKLKFIYLKILMQSRSFMILA